MRRVLKAVILGERELTARLFSDQYIPAIARGTAE